MALQKRKGRDMILLKRLILFITCLSFFGLLSCSNSGTNSTASSGGTAGTGTGWTISVRTFKNSASASGLELVGVIVNIKDRSGAPAPNGTQVCDTVSRGGFLVNGTTLVSSKCESTANDIGQVLLTYIPAVMGQVCKVNPVTLIETCTTQQVPISSGLDTIQSSSMGAFGSTTIEVVP